VSQLRLKILVVDREDSEVLRSLVSIFDAGGFNVDFCSDWDSLQRKLKNSVRATDFLIIDLAGFRDRDGYLLLTELKGKEYTKDLKIILITDSPIAESLLRTRRELGIVATFNKTRPAEELLYVLTNILPPSGENLRRSRRIPARFFVYHTGQGKTNVLCARNLSRGGIFVENHTPDPVGTLVELSFTLPGRTSKLVAKARVARATTGSHTTENGTFPAGNGLEFTELSEADASSLQEFMEQEESRIFGPEEKLNAVSEPKEHLNTAGIPRLELPQS
jgi:uncharacterized protein (TIGR02266 family)